MYQTFKIHSFVDSFNCSLNKYLLGFYSVWAVRVIAKDKRAKIPVLMELSFIF